MPTSNIISTTKYETDATRLSGGGWAVGQSLYIDIVRLVITNNGANAFVNANFGSNGVIGVLDEVPTAAGNRLVLRLSATVYQNDQLKNLLRATEL